MPEARSLLHHLGWRVRKTWWRLHDRLTPALPRSARSCHCRSYHERTGLHADVCPKTKIPNTGGDW